MALAGGRLLAVIVCPECFEVMRGPISMCVRGHSLCSPCRKTRERCSLCNGKYASGRNYLAENIIAIIFFQAYENVLRKTSSVPIEPTTTVATEVPHRHSPVFFCRVCGNYVEFAKLVTHFDTRHPANVLKNGKSRLVRKREVYASCVYTCQIESGGLLFWFWRRNSGHFVHFGIQYVGGGVPGDHRGYAVDITSPDREMFMRYQSRIPILEEEDDANSAASPYAVVAAHLLGEGASFSVTIM